MPQNVHVDVGERPHQLEMVKYQMPEWDAYIRRAEGHHARMKNILETYAYWHQQSLNIATANHDYIGRLLDGWASEKKLDWNNLKTTPLPEFQKRKFESADITKGWMKHVAGVRIAYAHLPPSFKKEINPANKVKIIDVDGVHAALEKLTHWPALPNLVHAIEAKDENRIITEYYKLTTDQRDSLPDELRQQLIKYPMETVYTGYSIAPIRLQYSGMNAVVKEIQAARAKRLSWPISYGIPYRKEAHEGGGPLTLEELFKKYGVAEPRLAGTVAKKRTQILDALAGLKDQIIEDEVKAYAAHYNWSRFKGVLRSLAAVEVHIGENHYHLLDHVSFAHYFPQHQQTDITKLEKKGVQGKLEVIRRLPRAIFANVEDVEALASAINAAHDKLLQDAIATTHEYPQTKEGRGSIALPKGTNLDNLITGFVNLLGRMAGTPPATGAGGS